MSLDLPKILISFLACGFAATSIAGEEKPEQKKFAIAPIISSSPSFGTGVGLTSSYLYKLESGNRPSQVLGALQYSNTDSYSLFARNSAFWDGGSKRAVTAGGTIKVKNDFDGARFDTESFLIFHRQLWRVGEGWFIGFNATGILSDYEAKNLAGQNFLDTSGAENNKVFGIGLSANYDTRDNFFYPYEGTIFEANTYSYLDSIGSDEDYDVLELRYSKYFPMRQNDVLALGVLGRYVNEDAPYSGESYLGRRSYLRGFNAGEVSGTRLTGVQVEYRYFKSLKWKWVAFAGAVSIGGGSAEVKGNDDVYYSAGIGVRYALQPVNRVHLRVDVAAGNDDNQGFYIGLQEAF